MNTYLFLAGCLAIIVGVTHSVLGEILIFNKLRNGTFAPQYGGPLLKESNVRILWASWHIVTIFGSGFGGILIYFSLNKSIISNEYFVINIIIYSMLISSSIVLLATKGKHPGWIGLLGVAILYIYNN